MKKILVITPTYNELANIPAFLDSIFNLEGDIDILVVDDSSPDGTGDFVSKHKEFRSKLFMISRPGKMGLGSAYCEGYRWALTKNYDKIIQIDADFSHNPKYIAEMLSTSDNFDLVIGSRYINGVNVVNWPMTRLLLSYTANIYCRLILNVRIKDFTGGFKCFNTEVLKNINFDNIKSEGYSFQVEMNMKVHSKGYSIKEIPIIFNDRALGTSKMSKRVIFEAIYMVPYLRIKKILGIL